MIFEQSIKKIKELRGQSQAGYSLNQFADFTDEEF
jgi:hypothetical protein